MAVHLSQEQVSFRGICACIAEFLQYEHLEGSLEAFSIEAALKGTSQRGQGSSKHETAEQTYMLLLMHFDRGDRKSFFSQWHSNVSGPLIAYRLDKLEFWLQLYFAVYPVLIGHSDDSSLSPTLPAFKQYLDTHGPLLADDPQLLSYYALPYVRKPQTHPAFAHIFTSAFVSDLRSQLSNVLRSAPAKSPLPRLYSMYAAAQAAILSPGSAALQSDGKSVQPGLGLNQGLAPPQLASGSVSRAVHCSSRAPGRELIGTSRPTSGARERESTGTSRPISGASERELTGTSQPISGTTRRQLTGNGQPITGKRQASSRPISALLNGSKELADLVSVSKARYADQSTAVSLEPSAEILQVVHSEVMGGGLSAEDSLQQTEHATGLDCHASAKQHAAIFPTNDGVADSLDASQGSPEKLSNSSQLPAHSQLEAGQNDSSIAAPVQSDGAATGSSSGGNAASHSRRPLELLAASRARQSLLASAAGSASTACSMALATNHSLTEQQLQQAVSVESSGDELPPLRPEHSAEAERRSQAGGDQLLVFHCTSAAEPSPGTAYTAQGSTAEVDMLHSNDILEEVDKAAAVTEPRFGSGSQQAAVTTLANSNNAELTSLSDTQEHAQLSHDGMVAAEGACITVALGAAETSVAASFLADASRDSVAPQDGEKPLENAAADEQTRISTSCSASSSGREHTQTEQDGPAGRPVSSSNRSSGSSTAGVVAASLDTGLQSHTSTSQTTAKVAVTGGSHAEEIRDSIGSGAAIAAVDSGQHSSRSSTDEAAGTDRPGRSPSLSQRSSASRVSVSSHAQPERSLSPELPAALNARLRSDDAATKEGQASVSEGNGMASCSMGASLSDPVNQDRSLTKASILGRSAKGVASMGESSSKLGGRSADAVNSSLSQMGKAGGGGVIRHSVILTGMDPLDQWLYRQPGVLTSLDYDKVKTDLQGGEAGLTAALLQSLRWRLDKAATASDRCQMLASYIENDVLMLRQSIGDVPWSGSSSSGSKAASRDVSEQWACLFGALADSHTGRAYLCTALTPVVQQLCHWLQAGVATPDGNKGAHSGGLSGYALEALQRLSLRREAQHIMAEHGVIRWLAHQLSQIDATPLCSLECCGALLMNLAMAQPGRQECHQLDMLVPLESLLEHDSMRVQTYANATLYSLLRDPDIRHTAHEKGLDDLLRHVQANASPVIGRQIQCVLKHWQDLELGKAANPASEDDANDQQDDDVQDAHTGAADGLLEAESIHSWGAGSQPQGLCCCTLSCCRPAVAPSREYFAPGSRHLSFAHQLILAMQISFMATLQASVSIRDMGAKLSPALSHSLNSTGSQAFALGKQSTQQSAELPALNHLTRSGNALLPAKLPKLIPAAKQEEYIAAFGSQTKLPRTPLLPGY